MQLGLEIPFAAVLGRRDRRAGSHDRFLEIAGAIGLLIPATRRAAGIGGVRQPGLGGHAQPGHRLLGSVQIRVDEPEVEVAEPLEEE